jgi:hypothetical protein
VSLKNRPYVHTSRAAPVESLQGSRFKKKGVRTFLLQPGRNCNFAHSMYEMIIQYSECPTVKTGLLFISKSAGCAGGQGRKRTAKGTLLLADIFLWRENAFRDANNGWFLRDRGRFHEKNRGSGLISGPEKGSPERGCGGSHPITPCLHKLLYNSPR